MPDASPRLFSAGAGRGLEADEWSRPYVLPARLDRGVDVLHDPVYNKGTGFPMAERDRLGIRGLVPPRFLNIEQQAAKVYEHIKNCKTNLDKWLLLQALQDRNETLFYQLIISHVEELAPVIYTPTVGEVCLQYSRLFRRARGMYFSAADRGNMHAMAYNWDNDRVDVIVVTDGSRVLGLGDLGVQGMGISVGKLDLYVAGAGLHPSFVLPVVLDVGTNNETLLQDPYYLGLPHPRLQGDEYYAVVDEFISAVRTRWPHVLVQFEDFSSDHAAELLERYRHNICCFNDDIQGTAAVVLGGVYGAVACLGLPRSGITQQRFLVCGAGSAGMGITTALHAAMMKHGLSADEAYSRFVVLDYDGVIGTARENVASAVLPFKSKLIADKTDLLSAVHAFKPTGLLGLSTVSGLFTEDVLTAMGQYNERPMIFPLSNPTSRAECTSQQAANTTQGRAIFSSGSPFPDAQAGGRTVKANQGNNFYVFGGVGLGVLLSGASHVSDAMLQAAAEALPCMLTQDDMRTGTIYPRVAEIRHISAYIAAAVMRAAYKGGLANKKEAKRVMDTLTDEELREWVMSKMFKPDYVPLIPRHKQ